VRTKLYQNQLAFVEDITKHFGVFLSIHSVRRIYHVTHIFWSQFHEDFSKLHSSFQWHFTVVFI